MTPPEIDLDLCAQEPIRIPGAVQPHGALVSLRPAGLEVVQASANAAGMLGPLLDAQGPAGALRAAVAAWRDGSDATLNVRLEEPEGCFEVCAHRVGEGASARLIVELEPAPGAEPQTLELLYPRIRHAVERMQAAPTLAHLAQDAADTVRDLTGLSRVMIYRFDGDWNGRVIAQSSDGTLPSYLDLRFPASDIPAQARDLYRQNRLRLIASSDYAPSPLVPPLDPDTNAPLDLSGAALRHVSPVHLEYMRNMGTGASMSVSILIDGELWGLISCHSLTPRRVSAPGRNACDLLGQVLAMQIGSLDRAEIAARRIALKGVEAELLARMSRETDFAVGLADSGDTWLRFADAHGAATIGEGEVRSFGDVPRDEDVRHLADWLMREHPGEVFHTDALPSLFPNASRFSDRGSGLLAISLSRLKPRYILWFRPEIVRTVAWGGDPSKPVQASVAGVRQRLSPRTSFSQWKELVRGRSAPWSPAELAAAREFRQSVIDLVLRRAEEQAELSNELQRANRELEAFSYSVSHDLRAPFRHIVGYAELLSEREHGLEGQSKHFLKSIIDSALSAGRLVDDLLAFSHLGRTSLARSPVNTAKLVEEVRRTLEPDVADRPVQWLIGELPDAYGDPSMLRQVFLNLVGNALKYTRGREPAVISIAGETTPDAVTFTVADNGVGFDMAYVDKLFGVFQRLHRAEDFEGTGIGLALARRIIDRHEGRIWAEGELGKGATLRFALPDGETRDRG